MVVGATALADGESAGAGLRAEAVADAPVSDEVRRSAAWSGASVRLDPAAAAAAAAASPSICARADMFTGADAGTGAGAPACGLYAGRGGRLDGGGEAANRGAVHRTTILNASHNVEIQGGNVPEDEERCRRGPAAGAEATAATG